MNAIVHRQLNRRQRRILRRLKNQPGVERPEPMMTASNIHYEMSERVRGLAPGGIGARVRTSITLASISRKFWRRARLTR